jgi:hypothetical protein
VKALLALALLAAGSACHPADRTLTVYFPQRLGGAGPHGQVVPVLEPIERERRPQMSAAWQALLELRQGPTPAERIRGFEPTLDLGARPLSVTVRGETAVVELVEPARAYGAAAIVYTLTGLDGIERVGLRVGGRRCCLPRMDGTHAPWADRSRYHYWTGVPCELRTNPDEVRCRRGAD